MTPDRWRRVETLFHQMQSVAVERRPEALAEACPDDPEVRARVLSLLDNPTATPDVLRRSALDASHGAGASEHSVFTGRQLGSFRVEGLLGAGGMGEVYRAHDTRLGRSVAIKILPRVFRDDQARIDRFEREARVLASLNHPHIGAIYGLEQAGDVKALVMELVDGDDLSSPAARPPTVNDALRIARQIAEALEAAHEQGIVHRDLKPGNIKIRRDRTVKVLDFGLAKALIEESIEVTTPAMMTEAGLVIGTPAYMSPEQARGDAADRQSDIWSFGVVLYELLTGVSPFARATMAETLAAVLGNDPDYSRLPSSTPPSVRHLVRRCLERDRKRRLQHIGDARIEIEDALDFRASSVEFPTDSRGRRTWARPLAGAVAMAIVAGIASWWAARERAAEAVAPLSRLSIPTLAAAASFPFGIRTLAIAPDGSRIAYAFRDRLWIRPIGRGPDVYVDGIVSNPFFSPDGAWVGYFHVDDGTAALSKVRVTGGAPVRIATTGDRPAGATWRADGAMVYASGGNLYLVSGEDAAPQLLARPDPAKNQHAYAWPQFLPSGQSLLFTVVTTGSLDAAYTAALDLNTREQKLVIRGATGARVTPTGHVVYAAESSLTVALFDPDTQQIAGEPVALPDLSPARAPDNGAADFALSDTGTLVFIGRNARPIPPRALTWIDRSGKEDPIMALPPGRYFYPRVSPTGTHIAFDKSGANRDIWVWDIARRTEMRVTTGPGEDAIATWDRRQAGRLFFSSNRKGSFDVYSQASDGASRDTVVLEAPGEQWGMSTSPDGRRLLVTENYADISVLALDGPGRLEPLLHSGSKEWLAEISPDGKWLAYESDEAGERIEILLRPYPDVTGRREQISVEGGRYPFWVPDREELYYVDPAGAMMTVPITTSPVLRIGQPRKLFDVEKPATGVSGRQYDVSPLDGRFIVAKSVGATAPPADISVVLNWFQELPK